MSDPHCPFLNRSDARCATHFSLNRLGSALDHCFGCYAACPTYHAKLDERRQRQQGHNAGVAAYAIAQHVQVRLPETAPSHAAHIHGA